MDTSFRHRNIRAEGPGPEKFLCRDQLLQQRLPLPVREGQGAQDQEPGEDQAGTWLSVTDQKSRAQRQRPLRFRQLSVLGLGSFWKERLPLGCLAALRISVKERQEKAWVHCPFVDWFAK